MTTAILYFTSLTGLGGFFSAALLAVSRLCPIVEEEES
jgi:hypothetical protein